MIEVLWHGRGGQGAFTAAKLLGAAYTLKSEKNYALAFPSFGPERRGAPIRAFTKLGDRPIGDRSETEKADFDIFLDDTLFSEAAFGELKPGGKILLNTKKRREEPNVVAFNATAVAEEILKAPIVNTVMLGALTTLLDAVSEADVKEAVRRYMPPKLQSANLAAISAAVGAARKESGE